MTVGPADGEGFDFRGLIRSVEIGTASDRYAGWIGTVYSPGRYDGGITGRTKKVGGKTFEERVLPVESVAEYFEHFPVLEIDFTFYRHLLDDRGSPTGSLRHLQALASHLDGDDRLFLKAPQATLAKKVLRGGAFVPNDDFLDPALFTRRFYEPAVNLLGSRLAGIIFEQEYRRAAERDEPSDLARQLEGFFAAIPGETRYHLELRTAAYLSPPLFDVMTGFGVGQVLSHWTWLPSLAEQRTRSGGGILSGDGRCLVRLLTPRGMRYDESYAAAWPFDALREGMASDRMIGDTVAVMKEVPARGGRVTVIVNNRAGGSAPLLAREIVGRYREQARR